jgi:hypothetical protein
MEIALKKDFFKVSTEAFTEFTKSLSSCLIFKQIHNSLFKIVDVCDLIGLSAYCS